MTTTPGTYEKYYEFFLAAFLSDQKSFIRAAKAEDPLELYKLAHQYMEREPKAAEGLFVLDRIGYMVPPDTDKERASNIMDSVADAGVDALKYVVRVGALR